MLRLIVLLLLLANAGLYAWSQGLLRPVGLAPAQQAEPHRLADQLRPEALQVVPVAALRRPEPVAPAPVATQCLLSPVLEEATARALEPLLAAWPPNTWTLEPAVEPGRWIVYMGRYDAGQLARKRGELRQLGVAFEAVQVPELAPGLSLGRHASEAAAGQQLESLSARGVRTARVVRESAGLQGRRLTLPAVDEALRPRLEELKAVLNGRPLRPCR